MYVCGVFEQRQPHVCLTDQTKRVMARQRNKINNKDALFKVGLFGACICLWPYVFVRQHRQATTFPIYHSTDGYSVCCRIVCVCVCFSLAVAVCVSIGVDFVVCVLPLRV